METDPEKLRDVRQNGKKRSKDLAGESAEQPGDEKMKAVAAELQKSQEAENML